MTINGSYDILGTTAHPYDRYNIVISQGYIHINSKKK